MGGLGFFKINILQAYPGQLSKLQKSPAPSQRGQTSRQIITQPLQVRGADGLLCLGNAPTSRGATVVLFSSSSLRPALGGHLSLEWSFLQHLLLAQEITFPFFFFFFFSVEGFFGFLFCCFVCFLGGN